jgi:YHS domain-containing protein
MPAMPMDPDAPLPQMPTQSTLPGLPIEQSSGPMPSLPSMEQGLPGLQPDRTNPAVPEKKPADTPNQKQSQTMPRTSRVQQVVYQESSSSKPLSTRRQFDIPTNLPLGLGGYCPVELVENEKWVPGTTRWKATHQGRTYLLSGPGEYQRFVTNPSRYCPVLAGMDPVLATDENRQVFGQTDFCVVYDGRLYMFAGEQSLARFHQNPKRYAAAAQ